MGYAKDPRVDSYIDALPDWQRDICRQVRDLVHAADPEVEETIKRTRQPYFVLQGNVCALLAAKDHVNVFLYDGAIVPDPEGIITGGHDNKTARTMAVGKGDTEWEKFLADLDASGYAGWITLDPLELPDRPAAASAGLEHLRSLGGAG